jgi:hypothetical protein
MDVIGYAKAHPVKTGAIVFGGGLVALFLFRGLSGGSGGSGGSSADDSLNSAYFAAESAQAQAGDQLQAVQDQDQATTAQTLIGANASVINNQTWAQAQEQSNDDNITITGLNDATSVQIAPYAVQSALVSALGTTASQPGGIVTNSSSNNGFFGLFGGSQSSQSYVANPAATAAAGTLASLAGAIGTNSSGEATDHTVV